MTYRDDYRRGQKEYFWTLPRAVFAVFAGVAFISGSAWIMNLASQPARVLSKTFDADNMIYNYEWFHDVNGNYLARTAQVRQFKGLLGNEADPQEKNRLRMEMAAMQQSCRELARRYNANAEKANRSIFMRGVPETLSAGECE